MNRNESIPSSDVIDNIMNVKFEKVQGLYDHGARHYLFINVPQIEKFPLNKNNSLYFGNSDIPYYNDKVKSFAINFANTHPDCNVLIYDAYTEFNYIMDNMKDFGIENISDSCRGSGEQCEKNTKYFWYNDIQPSYRVQEALGQDIHEFLVSRQVTVNDSKLDSSATTTSIKMLLLWNAILFLTFILF